MGKIKKILENELIGGTQSTDVYPVTSTKAVYDSSNKSLEDILKPLTENATFAGVATPTTNPGVPDGPVFYFASQSGTYSNFNGIELNQGLSILIWNGSLWESINIMTIAQGFGNDKNKIISQDALTYVLGLDKYDIFNKTSNYIAGDIVNYNGRIYQFTQSHSNKEWTGDDVIELNVIDLLSTDNNSSGIIENSAKITGYIKLNVTDYYYLDGRYVNVGDGSIINRFSSNNHMYISKINIEGYAGGKVDYYELSNIGSSRASMAFYSDDFQDISLASNYFIKAIASGYSNRNVRRTEIIPENAKILLIEVNTKDNEDPYLILNKAGSSFEDLTFPLFSGQEDYPLPLGNMDNLLVDAYSYNTVSSTYFIESSFLRDENNVIYGVKAKKSVRYNTIINFDGCTLVLRIKKSKKDGRCFTVRSQSGYSTFFDENVHEGPIYNVSTIRCYVIKQEEDYIWIYTTSALYEGEVPYIMSFTNSDRNIYEPLEIDMNRSFCLKGNYNINELNIYKKYYTRPEKIGSKLIGKNCIVFADSLGAFYNSLVQDWGLNIIAISEGGNRMGYYTGALNNWICRDDNIQKFKAYSLEKADYIIFAMGANDPTFEQSTKENVKFVLQNKRWFDSDAGVDPFNSLEDNDKNKFGSAASLYAAAYSLCRIYPDAIIAIIPPYKTPGIDVTEYDAEKYADVLFNGRFTEITEQMREVATTLGAIFIENRTRNNSATADTYHSSDGVHPNTFGPYQDEGSNIGYELSKYYNVDYDN